MYAQPVPNQSTQRKRIDNLVISVDYCMGSTKVLAGGKSK